METFISVAVSLILLIPIICVLNKVDPANYRLRQNEKMMKSKER